MNEWRCHCDWLLHTISWNQGMQRLSSKPIILHLDIHCCQDWIYQAAIMFCYPKMEDSWILLVLLLNFLEINWHLNHFSIHHITKVVIKVNIIWMLRNVFLEFDKINTLFMLSCYSTKSCQLKYSKLSI